MNIGFLGLGKLGLPVSLAVELKGHRVYGYDISQQTINDINNKTNYIKTLFLIPVKRDLKI